MQKSVVMVPGNIECDWFSFLTTEYDNAEGQGCLNSDSPFPPEIDPTGTLDTGPGQPVQLASTLGTHILDHDEGAARRVIPIYQNIPNERENNHSFGLLNSHDISGFPNSPSYGLIGHPLTSTTGRLTGLNLALYECARKLPSIKASREEPVSSINTPHTMDTSTREAALLALDDVFTVTNEFINVMQALCPTTGYHEIPITTASASTAGTSRLSASGANTALLHQAAPHGLAYPQSPPESSHQPATTIEGPHEPAISSPVIQPFPRLDEATALLFLSCHCRLAEIYESLFQAIRRCIEGPHRTASHPPAGIILPQLQVGGFGGVSRPALRVDFGGPRLPPATVSMYLVLTITLSSQLWTQVREAMLGGVRSRAPEARLAIAGPTWDTAMERTDNLSRTIEAVQTLL
ncbi:hypothetical protein ANO14919_096790 [Xylariales sp. No.14919]|nr:hypothetical protein ANO14919_096790 [Xylariales sp. No.14919]